ncbi:hypothetical protein MMC31_001246 [Peltigera leucophlebia]|nr:hypothetical protein [Peltigera leucophlebia]
MQQYQINDEELALGNLLQAEIDKINKSWPVETTQEVLPDGHEHRDLAKFFHLDEQQSGNHAVFHDPILQAAHPLTPPQEFDLFNDDDVARILMADSDRLFQLWTAGQFDGTQGVLPGGHKPYANQNFTDSHLGQQHITTSAPWDNYSGQIVYPYPAYPAYPGPSGESSETETFRKCRSQAERANYWNLRHADPNTARPKPIKYKSPEQRAAARLEKKASDELRRTKKAAVRERQMQRK